MATRPWWSPLLQPQDSNNQGSIHVDLSWAFNCSALSLLRSGPGQNRASTNGSDESDSDFQETDGENSFDDEESLPNMVEEDLINILGDTSRHEFNNRSDEMFCYSLVNSGELNNDKDFHSDARPTFPEFNKEIDMENPKFHKDILFCSKKILKETVRQYGRVNRTTILFKGYYVGYLLAAVGINIIGEIYPIAYAFVESENQYSWLWFLEILGRDLDIENSYDRLVEAVAEKFPNIEVRNCVRRIYANFKKVHKGKALKDALWKAARGLMDLNPQQWSKIYFSTTTKSDMLLNNLSECFNKATHAGGLKYQVECGPGHRHVVDMTSHSCSCRKWDLTGIPCIYAVVVKKLHNDQPEPYVHTCYHKSTQLAIYSNFICPVKGTKQWTNVTEMEPIMPLELRRPPGRPTKKRRKEADEGNKNGPKLSNKGSMGIVLSVMMPPSTTVHATSGRQESYISNLHNQDLHTTSKE
ncbi:hypothetical protein F3Y22_tig00111081pilonHSYRG00038 [Hibiscus syriacus]|uniref:Zinc finger PMZ-type domain-containing protein n=1 Tax=Hibiscus syriacus TaxID=106335 RepID=A0A6A2Z2T7_HIBSY|nr:hypothetical protein F3Y22_tig00111081pilonHSYRG00038 [Hibiscus syriacus]